MSSTAAGSQRSLVRRILHDYGETFAERLGISLKSDNSAGFFQLWTLGMLVTARTRPLPLLGAAKALFDRGWTTAERMAGAEPDEMAAVLLGSGYEASRACVERLQAASRRLLRMYGGDLRELRRSAAGDRERERALLTAPPGLSEAGVELFFREVQESWQEWMPFADRPVREGAQILGLPDDPHALLRLTGRRRYLDLVAGLAWMREHRASDAPLFMP